jgi:NADPH:quinone reductase-like Zn-dependent oxidoreductase
MREPSDQLPMIRSRAVQLDSFGGPEVLDIREVPVPQAGAGQVRVRVIAAGLNPMDWFMTADADTAVRFGLSLPAGFGTDYAGVVDQVGDGVTGFAPGDRVFGGALSRAVADLASPTRASRPSPPRSTGSRRPTAPTPPPAPWKSSLA